MSNLSVSKTFPITDILTLVVGIHFKNDVFIPALKIVNHQWSGVTFDEGKWNFFKTSILNRTDRLFSNDSKENTVFNFEIDKVLIEGKYIEKFPVLYFDEKTDNRDGVAAIWIWNYAYSAFQLLVNSEKVDQYFKAMKNLSIALNSCKSLIVDNIVTVYLSKYNYRKNPDYIKKFIRKNKNEIINKFKGTYTYSAVENYMPDLCNVYLDDYLDYITKCVLETYRMQKYEAIDV